MIVDRIENARLYLPLHRQLMDDTRFIAGGTSIHYLEKKLAALKNA